MFYIFLRDSSISFPSMVLIAWLITLTFHSAGVFLYIGLPFTHPEYAPHVYISYSTDGRSPSAVRDDMVRISMDTFVRRFQPERYELWLAGKDVGPHPEDPSRNTPANLPTHADVLCNTRCVCRAERETVPWWWEEGRWTLDWCCGGLMRVR